MVEISKDYALALHTDGVGTKVLVAEALGKYDTIGIDCVAMNVNDVICLGAEPIALVNYLALEKLRPGVVSQIMQGLRRGAREAGVAIVSGETAVMPNVVRGFDLAGTAVGVVRKDKIITGEQMKVGDIVFGLPSSGVHSNGLTLARKVLLRPKYDANFARELLRPTRIYVDQISRILKAGIQIHGLAHITGGAYSKLKRIGRIAKVGFYFDRLPHSQRIFQSIQSKGHIPDREMYRTFNMGVGFMIVCPRRATGRVIKLLPDARQIGLVTSTNEVTIHTEQKEVIVEKW